VAAGWKNDVLQTWMARTIQSWPAARSLAKDADAFHNPAGHALSSALPVLLASIVDDAKPHEVTSHLDRVVRIGAVQNATPAETIAFLFLLKPILREHGTENARAAEDRIDSLALQAFDLFMRCREEIYRIKAAEARRSSYVQERIGARRP
jgi:hypothetical protein